MTAPPTFASLQEYNSRLGDLEFWRASVAAILRRHDLGASAWEAVAGAGGTYPTFLHGEVVVKLFGYLPSWRKAHRAEHAAHTLLATDPGISAPQLLASGRLADEDGTPWPYLITTRMSGVAWSNANLSPSQRLAVAVDLGRQVRRLHSLQPSGVATHADWPTPNVTAATEQSSLPPHLVAQVEDYLARLRPFDPVFVHADLVGNHVFVENGRLTGIIDWGDAMVTDRHCEIIQPFRDMFDCDKSLLRAYLEASDWPISQDFPRQALGLALHRQAVGLAQHPTMDVFEPIAARYPLQDIATLDELATELFAV